MSAKSAKCPGCAGRMIRYSSAAWRHILRCLIGSRRRYCLHCGLKWSGPWLWGPAHPLSMEEFGQAARHSLVIPICAGLVAFTWVGVKARHASAQLHAQAYLQHHNRYLLALDREERSEDYHFPFLLPGRPRVSSGFGYRDHPILNGIHFHQGMDIPLAWGTAVVPARSGVVEKAGWNGGYGMSIIIRHPNDESTVYGHLSSIIVAVGDRVEVGKTRIGRVGSTGLSTGPHLHFEVRDANENPVDPDARLVP